MKIIKGKNGVASLYGLRYAYVVDDKAILFSYESTGFGSDFGNRVRLDFETAEDTQNALNEIFAAYPGKVSVKDLEEERSV